VNGITDAAVFESFPGVAIDHDNIEHYRGILQRRLLVNRCADCGTWHEPARSRCPACWSTRVEPTKISGRGVIALFTVLHHGPPATGIDYQEGHPVAAVELAEQPGLRFTATIVDCKRETLRIGLPVELTWIERVGVPVPAFRPAEPRNA
jgi:uncharacterized OB-fold protein